MKLHSLRLLQLINHNLLEKELVGYVYQAPKMVYALLQFANLKRPFDISLPLPRNHEIRAFVMS